jgi:hypothetical protein
MLDLNLDDFADCVETYEQAKAKLEDVEDKLAQNLKLRRQTVRRELIAMDRRGELVEDELVALWHDLYSSYVDWTRPDTWGEPSPPASAPAQTGNESDKRAAEAAFIVL